MTRKCFLLLFLLFAAPPCFGEVVRLSAAASMTDAVKELAASYAKEHPDVSFHPNFGSSGALAKQVLQGAPADLFISANPKWMEHLIEQKAVPGETVRIFAGNTLVFVGRGDPNAASMEDLPALERIAIGSPKSVPAGQYARQTMEKAGVWERLSSKGKLVFADDVRQALLYADRGEVDGAFVYRTDALLARNAVILFEVPQDLYDPVTYPVGLTAEGAKNPAAVAFYEYLKSPAAKEILEKYGFVVK